MPCGVTRSLSQGWRNLTEGEPMATVWGQLAKLKKKKLRNDSESGCSGCLYQLKKKENTPKNEKTTLLKTKTILNMSAKVRAGLTEREAPGRVATARPPKRLAQLHMAFYTRFNFAEAPVIIVRSDMIWHLTFQRQNTIQQSLLS